MGRVPCVRGTRIPVATVLGLLGDGLSPAEVNAEYPQLVVDDCRWSNYVAQSGRALWRNRG